MINCRLLAVKLAFRNARGTAEKLEMIYEIVLNLNLTISFPEETQLVPMTGLLSDWREGDV